jgi:hypothetical protein
MYFYINWVLLIGDDNVTYDKRPVQWYRNDISANYFI